METLAHAVEIGKAQGNLLVLLDATGSLALLMSAHGRLREATALCEEVQELGQRPDADPIPAAGLVHVPLGILAYEADRLEMAEHHLTLGVRLCRRVGMIYFALRGLVLLARLKLAGGDREAAFATLAEARALAAQSESGHRLRQVDVAAAELYLAAGDRRRALSVMETSDFERADPRSFLETVVGARIAAVQGQPKKAIARLTAAEATAGREGRSGHRIALLVHLASTACQIGRKDLALDALSRAITFAAPEGFARVFIDAGPAIRPQLRQLLPQAPDFVQHILDRSEATDPRAVADTLELGDGERFTATQVEVLKLLCRGLTNQQIADDLDIALGTAKWHLNQIYQKFGVGSRSEAILYAQEKGLVPRPV